MFNFFVEPYEDEIFYSILARYHYYTGNTHSYKTFIEVFDTKYINYNHIIPNHINKMISKIPECSPLSNVEEIITKFTFWNLYKTFMPAERKNVTIEEILQNKPNVVGSVLPRNQGIPAKKGLWYCPICVIEDIEKYGEGYFHRTHQFEGVWLCPSHGCKIEEYPIEINLSKSRKLIRFNVDELEVSDFLPKYEQDEKLACQLKRYSDSVEYIMQNDIMDDADMIFTKYYTILNMMGYRTDKVLETKFLVNEFQRYFGSKFLNLLYSDASLKKNWLFYLSGQRYMMHPMRHILLILFLCESVEAFFSTKLDDSWNASVRKDLVKGRNYHNFGKGSWQCHNTLSEHNNLHTICNRKKSDDKAFRQFNTSSIDWKQRDIQIVDELKKAYEKLLNSEFTSRITKTRLLNSTNRYSMIRKNIEKLPLTQAFLKEVVETLEMFWVRKVKYVCEKVHAEKGVVTRCEIRRAAAIYSELHPSLQDKLNYIIEGYFNKHS